MDDKPVPYPPRMSSSAPSTSRKPLKVQPKNIGRRSEAERKRIEKEEAERRKARLDAAAQDAAAEEERRRAAYGYMTDSRGRGGRGGDRGGDFRGGRGGRGGFMGGREDRNMGRGGFVGRGGRGQGRVEAFPRIKKEGQTDQDGDLDMGDATQIKQERGGGYISSDDDEEPQEGRKNIEYINLTSDEDEEEEDSKERSMHRATGLMPVRLKRIQHVDRVMGINTEASSATAAKIAKQVEARMEEGDVGSLEEAMTATTKQGKARAKDIEYMGGVRKWKGVYDDKDASHAEVRIKEEPREDDVTMLQVPEPSTAPQTPHDMSAAASDDDVKPQLKKAPKQRRKSGLKGPRGRDKPTFQTEEERIEWEIQQHDLEVLQDELGRIGITPKPPAPTTLPQLDGAAASTPAASTSAEDSASADPETRDQRADNVYIFQLPPILPGLSVHRPPRIKPESPTLAAKGPVHLDDPPAAATQVIDSDEEEETRRSEARETAIKPKLQAGRAGKLRVYKSGRVTLDWGGASLEVSMGLNAYFLQSAVLTRMAEGKGEGEEWGGEAMSFGQVRGKFVVTPDWEEILG